jgi:hypothetical protein
MPKKKTPDPSEKPQRERFIEAAREHGVDETGEEFERAFKKIVPPRRAPTARRS